MTVQRLGLIARTVSGVGFPVSEQGGTEGDIPFLKVSDLGDPRNADGVVTASNWVTNQQAKQLGVRLVPTGSIVFPKVGAALLGNARALTKVPTAIDNNMMAVTPSAGDARYWLYALTCVDLAHLSMGGTLPFVTDSSVRDLRLRVPPSLEQHRIADFLDDQTTRIDQIIAAREEQVSALAAALGSGWGSAVDEMLASHPTASLRRFFDFIEQGGSPNGEDRAPESGDLSVLKTSAVKFGRFDGGQAKVLIDPCDFDPRFEVRPGDVLVVRGSGSAGLVADVAEAVIEPGGPRIMLSDLTYRLVGLRLDPAFVVALLLSQPIRRQIRAAVRQGSGPAKVRGEDIASLAVPVLDEPDQRLAARRYWGTRDDSERAQESLRHCISLLHEFKRSLISAAVSGEFDVSTASGRGVPA